MTNKEAYPLAIIINFVFSLINRNINKLLIEINVRQFKM